jgi:hypothetical protein
MREPTVSGNIDKAIDKRWPWPSYAVLREVTDGTGANMRRRADAIVVGLWPSRGLLVEGIEVKMYRGDLRRELENPAKADAWVNFCDRWWLVCGPGVVRDDDPIPALWGVLELKGGVLVQRKEAPALERQQWSPTRLASVVRRAHESAQAEYQRGLQDGQERAKTNQEELYIKLFQAGEELRKLHYVASDAARTRDSIRRLEEHTGLQLWQLLTHDGLRAAKHLVERPVRDYAARLQDVAIRLESLVDEAKQVRAAAESLRAVEERTDAQSPFLPPAEATEGLR